MKFPGTLSLSVVLVENRPARATHTLHAIATMGDASAAASPPALVKFGSDEETRNSIDIERLVKAREDQLDEVTGLDDPHAQHNLA